jgi:hypothetical protein
MGGTVIWENPNWRDATGTARVEVDQ